METEKCGGTPPAGTDNSTWDCLFGINTLNGELPADRPEIIAEIGPGCRCGCIVHLGLVKPRRLIASSSQSCPGRTFWLIQADPEHRIRIKIDFLRLPCSSQYVKFRDGDSIQSQLMAEHNGGALMVPTLSDSQSILSSSESQVLLEFFSDELASMGQACEGGFLIHAQQITGIQSDIFLFNQ